MLYLTISIHRPKEKDGKIKVGDNIFERWHGLLEHIDGCFGWYFYNINKKIGEKKQDRAVTTHFNYTHDD